MTNHSSHSSFQGMSGVVTTGDLRSVMHTKSDHSFEQGLRDLVAQGILVRVCRGIYTIGRYRAPYAIEEVALALRRGALSYVSLESALSEHGVISQIPISRITVMTTGRVGSFETSYGTIEFVHTARSSTDIICGTNMIGRPLRFATPQTALRDLRRVGRSMHLVSMEDYEDVVEDYEFT